ncbi:solute carrier family 23 protein [Klebsiella pneumoniae]
MANRWTSPPSPRRRGSGCRTLPPSFNGQAMMLIAPVAVILVAQNLGHLKAVAGMTGDMEPYMGRAFVGDGVGDHALRFGGRQRGHHLCGRTSASWR